MRTLEGWIRIACDFLRQHEGFRGAAYQDSGGVWTIGYGRTGPDVVEGLTTTREAEEAWLLNRMEREGESILKLFPNSPPWMGAAQVAALVALQYNIGRGAFCNSHLCRLLGTSGWTRPEVETEWKGWRRAGGQIIQGLVNRRQEELDLFFGDSPA